MESFFDIGDRVFAIIEKGDIRHVVVLELLNDEQYLVTDGSKTFVVQEKYMYLHFHHARIVSFEEGKVFYFFPSHLMGACMQERSVGVEVSRVHSPKGKGEVVDLVMESGKKLNAIYAFASNFEATQAICKLSKSTNNASLNYHTIADSVGRFQAVQAARFDSIRGICGYIYLN